MNKNLIMLSGLPRSGSQVLSSMLNQHPSIYSTTTSPLVDMLVILNDNWPIISQAQVDKHPDQFKNMMSGMIDGACRHIDKNIIVDKNRLWPRYSKLMGEVLGYRPRIICTVRSIPDILSSYILLIEKNKHKITYIDQDLIDLNLPINNKNRCKILWEKYIINPYTSLQIGINSREADLLFVHYENIVNDGQTTVDKICDFIGIDRFRLDSYNLKRMDENDDYHGGLEGLHNVRPLLEKTSPSPEKVIGKDLVNLYLSMNLEFWKKYER
jgi:sulfotransferase